MVTQNSRCVTVKYGDGTTVDLMPVARLAGGPERAGHLFHYKKETGETFHKEVNPWAFSQEFNQRVEFDPAFYKTFTGRRLLVEGLLEKAETQPMPDHAPIEEKSPRVVALQLIKRNRDINFREPVRRNMRKPPSVVLAAISLDAGAVKSSLIDEVINVANAIRTKLREKTGVRRTVVVRNPAYPADVFTDRWPENENAQDLFDGDLRRLTIELYRLRNEDPSMPEKSEILKRLFGETAATYAIESNLDARRHEMEAGRLQAGNKGKIAASVAAPAVVGMRTSPVRAATREGGGPLKE